MSKRGGIEQEIERLKHKRVNMGIPILNANGQHTMSQQQAQAIQAQNTYLGVYLSLVPVAMADELRNFREQQSSIPGDDTKELDIQRIVNMAQKVAVAAVKVIGINVELQPPQEQPKEE